MQPRISPIFFATPDALRAWFAVHHATARELWVGFHKKGSGQPSITWPESVDEALCVGWIDGVRRSLDADSYVIRFTPRKPNSNWSAVNVRRMEALLAAGRVLPAGREAYARRREETTAVYSFEQRRQDVELPAEMAAELAANAAAAADFAGRPPWYRRTATWWIVSAKKEETRWKRLRELIARSAAGQPIGPLDRTPRTPPPNE